MAEILTFPVREANGSDMERYLMARESLALGVIDPFGNWVQTLDNWFFQHPEAHTRRNSALRSLLADTWLVFHMACDKTSELDMKPHHYLRWAQLQYHNLSDFELLVIVSDNLSDLRRWLIELCQLSPLVGQGEPNLFELVQGIDRLHYLLGHLYHIGIPAPKQPE